MEKIDKLDRQILNIISRMLGFLLKMLPRSAVYLVQLFINGFNA